MYSKDYCDWWILRNVIWLLKRYHCNLIDVIPCEIWLVSYDYCNLTKDTEHSVGVNKKWTLCVCVCVCVCVPTVVCLRVWLTPLVSRLTSSCSNLRCMRTQNKYFGCFWFPQNETKMFHVFWTIEAIWRCHIWLWEIEMSIYSTFLTFHGIND